MNLHSLHTILSNFIRKYRVGRIYAVALLLLAVISGSATYSAFTKSTPFEVGSKTAIILLYCDLAILLLLSVAVAQRLVKIRTKHVGAGSRLHSRLIRWFGLLLVTPSIVIAIFSAVFFNLGVESWFSERVQTALTTSTQVAEAYLEEHKKVISSDIKNMADDLAAKFPGLIGNPVKFKEYLNQQTEIRGLSEAIVFTHQLDLLARSDLTLNLLYQEVTKVDLKHAHNRVVILHSETKDRVRALINMHPKTNVYLLVGRFVDPQVLGNIADNETAVSEYHQLEALRSDYEINFILIFAVLSLLLLLSVIWIGLIFANRLAKPVVALINAADKIRMGDLSVRVNTKGDNDELDLLSHTFNRMASQIETQTKELVDANQQIDNRRRLIEAVSDGVSAGVLGLDPKYKITWANKTAVELLGSQISEIKGMHLEQVVPEMGELIKQPVHTKAQAQISIIRSGYKKTFMVRMVPMHRQSKLEGYVATFDDITELLTAQRAAAWSDVARRIAHEIKNPLTPIQLSAERLQKRYLSQIDHEAENFQKYTDTIVRQVSYIGEMVSEFSEFARMPNPTLRTENLFTMCEQAILLQKTAHPAIEFQLHCKQKNVEFSCDAAQIDRVLTNILQNAIDSIDSRGETSKQGKDIISLEIIDQPDQLVLTIDDSGEGFPEEGRELLTEPYVTRREKGTGLGLAMVKRIIEDHSGTLSLENVPGATGARVKICFVRCNSIIQAAS